MAERALRLGIPSSFVGVDEDAYGPNAPASSWLGGKIAQNDRFLASNLRRSFGIAFPQNQTQALPRLTWASGTLMGTYDWLCTPGAREGQWYIRADIPNGETVYVIPYVSGLLQMASLDTSTAFSMVGTGSEETYGPLTVPLRDTQLRKLALLMFPPVDTSSATTGTLTQVDQFRMVATTGVWAGATHPTMTAVRTYHLIGADKQYHTGWLDVINVTTTSVAGDTAYVYPQAIRGDGNSAQLADGYLVESAPIHPVYIHSLYFTESPLDTVRTT